MLPDHLRRAIRVSVILVLLLAMGAAAAHAQLVAGQIVRINTGGWHTVSGDLVSLDSVSLVIRTAQGEMRYPRPANGEVEVLAGSHRAGLASVGQGAAIGLGVGGL